MKKLLFFLLLPCLSFSQQDRLTKTEHLLRSFGNDGYSGWYITKTYDVDEKNSAISDTVYTVLANSANYQQISEPFIVLATKEKKDIINMFDYLDETIKTLPKGVSSKREGLLIKRHGRFLIVSKLDDRTDHYAYYSKNKRIRKAVNSL